MNDQALESLALDYTKLALEALERPLNEEEISQKEAMLSESGLSNEALIQIGKAKLTT